MKHKPFWIYQGISWVISFVIACYDAQKAGVLQDLFETPSEIYCIFMVAGGLLCMVFCYRDWVIGDIFIDCFKWVKPKIKALFKKS